MKKSRLLGLVAVLVLAAGAAATFAWAQASDATTINACVAKDNGAVRIVKAGANCRRDETATSWNTTGPQGPAGAAGGNGGGGSVIGTISITGTKTGQVSVEVDGFKHEIVSPRDPASGLPTGKRQHKPLTITAPVGAASPLLMSLLVTDENMPTVILSLYKPGTTTVGTTIKLTNASVSDFSNQCDKAFPGCETISMTYQKIEWTWVDSNTSASDDWEAPVA